MTTAPSRNFSILRAAATAFGIVLMLTSCGGNTTADAERVAEPTAIAAPSGIGSDGAQLTLEVVDGGPATGLVLTDHRGFVLYGLTGETVEEIICDDDCTDVWIPLAPRSGGVASALDADEYSIIERPNGSAQAAYRGVPLYLWSGDTEVGVTGGAGVAGTWFALTAAGGQIDSSS